MLKGSFLSNVKSSLADVLQLYWLMSRWKTYTQKGIAEQVVLLFVYLCFTCQ